MPPRTNSFPFLLELSEEVLLLLKVQVVVDLLPTVLTVVHDRRGVGWNAEKRPRVANETMTRNRVARLGLFIGLLLFMPRGAGARFWRTDCSEYRVGCLVAWSLVVFDAGRRRGKRDEECVMSCFVDVQDMRVRIQVTNDLIYSRNMPRRGYRASHNEPASGDAQADNTVQVLT